MTATTAEPGLRERKKAATRQALYEAAVRLAVAHGADNVTVEAVADEAGVSRRTFSNYFANKDEALLHGDRVRMAEMVGMIRERPAAEDAWTALSRTALACYASQGTLDPQWVEQVRLLRQHPALLSQQARVYASAERELAAAVAERLDDPDDRGLRARLMIATFLGAMRVALHVWLENADTTDIQDITADALAEAGRGFGNT
ncbi:TetR/AcrR family transcriptional regulator [Symbioplanes lichenis]|uniref:TetR/AcrR family transcriptional regulator n=1 Tax=Symbioplanes lichenis TaxID=1629072 RepID=UPI002738E34D|nr:TetR/AcrR family transcriptional regulator [Actinoplanes lichenis]